MRSAHSRRQNVCGIVLPQGQTRWIEDVVSYLQITLDPIYDEIIIVSSPTQGMDNFVIDGFFPSLDDLHQIKGKSKLIFVPTEYGRVSKNRFYLNCFSCRQFVIWAIVQGLNKYVGSREKWLLRRFKNSILAKLFEKVFGYELLRIVDYVERSDWFGKWHGLFDGILSYTPGLVEPYSERSGKPGFAIESFLRKVDVEKMSKRFPPHMYFSGRITSHRSKILKKLTDMELGDESSKLEEMSFVYVDKDSEIPEGYDLELYIPQHNWWPYSSPLRTYRSLRKGLLPVNLRRFDNTRIDKTIPTISQLKLIKSPEEWRNWLYNFNSNVDEANTVSMTELGRFKKFLFENS
jgi:hypothetical protein